MIMKFCTADYDSIGCMLLDITQIFGAMNNFKRSIIDLQKILVQLKVEKIKILVENLS